MVTNTVNMDVKVGNVNSSKARESDGGFSDVLGNVSSEGRRQQGLSDSGKKDFRKEFGYTERASERPYGARKSGDGSRRADVGDGSGRADFGDDSFDAQTADSLLTKAAEAVTRAVNESGETPTKEEAADMMIGALKDMVSSKKDDTAGEITDEIVEVLAEVIASVADVSGNAADAGMTEEFSDLIPDEPTVHVVSPDASFVMTAKHVEAAMIAGNDIEEATADEAEFAAELENMLQLDIDDIPDDDLMSAGDDFTEHAMAMVRTLAEMPDEPEMPQGPDLSGLSDTARMLAEIIEDAKKELGLTDVKYEHITETESPEAVMMHNEPVKLSHSMNSRDGTGELDHILNEGRSDANAGRFDVSEDDNAPKTETYDAVHMSAELMGSRTDTDIPVENEPVPEQAAEIRPPEIQTAEQILERIQSMQDDHTEFTMVLNPESLGRITVKLVMAGERTAVEINAENPETRAILASRSENLQNMLRENGVELERYQVVSEHEDTQFNEQSYDGSSKNPYGRDEEQQHHDDDDDGENFYDLLQSI